MGINCLFGAIGNLVVAKVGGICFDVVSKESPFVGVAFMSFLSFLLMLVPSVRKGIDTESTSAQCG
jgi:hypothetical protein